MFDDARNRPPDLPRLDPPAPDPVAPDPVAPDPVAPDPVARDLTTPTGQVPPLDLSAWAAPGVERPPVPVVLPTEVLAVQEAVLGLVGWQPASLDGPVALAATTALIEAERIVAAARTRSLSDIENRQLHRQDGARSLGTWLGKHDAQLPAAQITLARRLASLPLIADELAAGTVSVSVAQRLQASLSTLRPHLDRDDGLIDGQDGDQALYGVIVLGIRAAVCQARGGMDEADPALLDLVEQLLTVYQAPTGQLARLEAALLLLARHLPPAMLPDALTQLVDSLLPLQHEQRNRRGEQDRGATLRKNHDGSGWRLEADLDIEAGERLWTALDAELRRDPDNPIDTAAAVSLMEQGLDPYDPALGVAPTARPRSRRERMHDALSAVLGRYLAADLAGSHDKNPVQLLVTVPAATLDDRPGSAVAVSASGMTLPHSLVRRWACRSALTRFVLDLGGRVIETSHTERTLKAHERRALRIQTGGFCQTMGCTRRSTDAGAVVHPHHGNPWATTGSTSLEDTALLCDGCHTHLHHGHVLQLKDGRCLGPDGWVS